jgi:hypothetical protein
VSVVESGMQNIGRREFLLGTIASVLAGPAPARDVVIIVIDTAWLDRDGWEGIPYRYLVETSKARRS